MGRFRRLIESVVGESGDESLSRLQRSARFAYLLVIHCAKQLVRHRAPQLAAALAYRTIFSIIPVLVLALVVLNATFDKAAIERAFNAVFEYTGLADIQVPADPIDPGEQLVENGPDPDSDPDSATDPATQDPGQQNAPAEDSGAQNNQNTDEDPDGDPSTVALTAYLSEFVERAADRVTNLSFGVITVVGLAVFLYAAISLLIQVEAAFNVVTGARKGRRLTTRLINYWAVLTFGSILIVASLAVGQIYQTRLAELPGFLAAPLSILGRFGATWLLLLLAYMLMPTARVFVKPAAVGALVAAIAWETSKSALFWFVSEMTAGPAAIYGSLAILPVALLWIYVTWFIVLFGLELAYSFQTVREVDLHRSLRGKVFDDDPMVDPVSPVIVMAEVARAFTHGKSAAVTTIRDQAAEPDDVISRLLKSLEKAGFVHSVAAEEDAVTHVALAKDPACITLAEVMNACDHLFEPSASQRQGRRGRKLTHDLRAQRDATWGAKTLADIVAERTDDEQQPESPAKNGTANDSPKQN
jgi:membrane protein